MIDIESSLRGAAVFASSWTEKSALGAAGVLGRRHSARIDWDDGAGESWARVLGDRGVIAYVSMVLPLVFSKVGNEVLNTSRKDICHIAIDNFDEPVLRCSVSVLGEIFGHPDRFHVLNSEEFSVNDLWYATV